MASVILWQIELEYVLATAAQEGAILNRNWGGKRNNLF